MVDSNLEKANSDNTNIKIKGDDLKDRIDQLENRKKTMIDEIKLLNRELKLKTMEQDAVKKLADRANDMGVDDLSRQLRSLEFRVSTQALTPAVEKKFVKKIITVEKQLAKLKPYLNAKKRLGFLEKKIEGASKKVEEIEVELKEIREELRELYRKYKLSRRAKKTGVVYGEDKKSGLFTLEDMVGIEGLDQKQ